MAAAECVLESLRLVDRYVERMTKARTAAEIVEIVQQYLANWPADRVASVQKLDGGWAPFDQDQQPVPVYGTIDISHISAALRDQREALAATRVELPPEFLELDLFFFVASLMLDNLEANACSVPARNFPSRRRAAAMPASR